VTAYLTFRQKLITIWTWTNANYKKVWSILFLILTFVYLIRYDGTEPYYQKFAFAAFAALITPVLLFALFWAPIFILMGVWAGLDTFYRKLRRK
jgi:hypothetical protein